MAVDDLRELLPESIDGIGVEEYLERHILQRPRDYVNFFRMLQRECGAEPRAGEGHVIDTIGIYCANRLIDLENEFGHNYPGISKCISSLQSLPEMFKKEDLLRHMTELLANTKFRREAPGLVMNFGQPMTLCRILISIGAVGIYDEISHALRFVHEFSESRVAGLWDAATLLSVHPVYCYRRPKPRREPAEVTPTGPAIVMHPSDYIPELDAPTPTEGYTAMMSGRRKDLIAALSAVDKGQAHYRRYEEWVREVLRIAFIGDLTNLEEQIQTSDGNKKFEIIFDVVGEQPPWTEIKGKYETHRLLVECKNTEEPTDADFNKLTRDMQSLNIRVALLAYRGLRREPRGKMLDYQRAAFVNSNRQNVIVSLSDSFFLQCLEKPNKSSKNFNTLWRDHLHRWLPL